MKRRGSLSARLRAEVQSSTTLCGGGQIGGVSAPYPCDVKPGIFFYKFLQPYEHKSSGNCRRLKLNLPLTVVAERTNGQEAVLWLETDSTGRIVRQDKAPIWRRKLFTDLSERAQAQATEIIKSGHDTAREVALAVRTTSRWKPKPVNDVGSCSIAASNLSTAGAVTMPSVPTVGSSGGRSSVLLTSATFDPIVNIPCDLPVCVQQFVRSRGLQASVYRIYWDENEAKCYGINFLNGLRYADAPVESSTVDDSSTSQISTAAAPVSIPSATALGEQALARATAHASYFCVLLPRDAKKLMNLTKIRGKPVAEPLKMARQIVEHAQMHLPGVRFQAMTVEFIRDLAGIWWFLGVIDFRAEVIGLNEKEDTLDVEPLAKASAVHLADLQRTRLLCKPRNVLVSSMSVLGNAAGAEGLMTRSCFLCGSLCELSAQLKQEVLSLMKGDPCVSQNNDDTRELLNSIADYRMTIKMALETVYLLRQRGVVLSTWEAALQAVLRSPVQGVVEFSVCILCYRIFKHEQSLRDIAHELHSAFSSASTVTSQQNPTNLNSKMSSVNLVAPLTGSGVDGGNQSIGMGFAGSLNTELYDVRPQNVVSDGLGDTSAVRENLISSSSKNSLSTNQPSIVERIIMFQREVFPSILLARNRAIPSEDQHSQYEFRLVDGGAVDPSSAQMRLVFFFHELQDGGPDLNPTDYYLEYQLGRCFYRIHLEGSKCHTPNRWQLCEARIHYFLATVEAFTTYCADKKMLIKMKRHVSSTDSSNADENCEDEFFGFAVLAFKPLITAAKWFGNSLLPESRSDYLLELHTTQFGLLTLKLTVGLLVDAVPLRNVRDVVCSRPFLEERTPIANIYWPPPSLCLAGLAIPRDWIGALMPSEYISVLPMRSRTHPLSHAGGNHRIASGSSHHQAHRLQQARSSSSVSDVAIQDSHGLEGPPTEQTSALPPPALKPNSRTALGRACMLASSLASRISVDHDVETFPTILLASILRLARFVTGLGASRPAVLDDTIAFRGWIKPASFHFTRRLSLDQLLGLVRAPLRSTFILLGELLMVLRRNRLIPDAIDVMTLEALVEPFWLHKANSNLKNVEVEWQSVPRTSAHLPERRAVWNRAIRRAEAARTSSSSATVSKEPKSDFPTPPSPSKARVASLSEPGCPIARCCSHREMVNSAFRYELQTLTLCELFEEMEAVDNGYLDIAELRSLSKIYEEGMEQDLEMWNGLPNMLELVGSRERLTSEELLAIAHQVDQQQRRTVITTLRSMLESEPMIEALERFDQQGYGYLSFDDFRQLADHSLQADRDIFRAFRKEPTILGFCIRHGATDVFAIDMICVQCTSQFINQEAQLTTASPESARSLDDNGTSADAEIRESCDEVPVETEDASRRNKLPGVEVDDNASPTRVRDYPVRRRRTVTIVVAPELPERQSTHENELHEVMTRLEAAEWHVRHRQESMGKASFSQLIADHSAQAEAIRTLARSPSAGSNSVADLAKPSRRGSVESSDSIISGFPSDSDTKSSNQVQRTHEGRWNEANVRESSKATVVSRAKRKKTVVKTSRVRPASRPFTGEVTPSMSQLLRMELGDAIPRKTSKKSGCRSKGRAHSTDLLIERVSQTEAKRKKLDQLVLAELDEVKQRLSRLMQER